MMETYKCADPGCRKIVPMSADKCDTCNLSREKSMQYYSNPKSSFYGGRGRSSGGRSNHDRSSRRGGGGGGGSYNRGRKFENSSSESTIDLTNPTVAPFYQFAKFLDARHDQHERIVKLSRDITIESKRVIFLLHRIQSDRNEGEILKDAKRKLDDIRYKFWFYVAKELSHLEQPHLYLRAYTAGLQEYIEALSFYHYIANDKLITWIEVQENLTFPSRHDSTKQNSNPTPGVSADPETETPASYETKSPKENASQEEPSSAKVLKDLPVSDEPVSEITKPDTETGNDDDKSVPSDEVKDETKPEATLKIDDDEKSISVKDDTTQEKIVVEDEKSVPFDEENQQSKEELVVTIEEKVDAGPKVDAKPLLVLTPKSEYLLGIADLTGEMMRKAVTSASTGQTDSCFRIFSSLQDIHSAFATLGRVDGHRELARKTSVLEASLKKVEAVCYNINVRSTEIPSHLIGNFISLGDDPGQPQESEDNYE